VPSATTVGLLDGSQYRGVIIYINWTSAFGGHVSQKWESRVSLPMERKIFEALSDSRWDYRTVDGIADQVGVATTSVFEVLNKYSDLVRKVGMPDRKGRELYTLRSRPETPSEKLALARTFVAKSVR
jgi:hypothetical protein